VLTFFAPPAASGHRAKGFICFDLEQQDMAWALLLFRAAKAAFGERKVDQV
jgi:hypothetical protein